MMPALASTTYQMVIWRVSHRLLWRHVPDVSSVTVLDFYDDDGLDGHDDVVRAETLDHSQTDIYPRGDCDEGQGCQFQRHACAGRRSAIVPSLRQKDRNVGC